MRPRKGECISAGLLSLIFLLLPQGPGAAPLNQKFAYLVKVLVEVEYLSLVVVVTSLVVELPLGQ